MTFNNIESRIFGNGLTNTYISPMNTNRNYNQTKAKQQQYMYKISTPLKTVFESPINVSRNHQMSRMLNKNNLKNPISNAYYVPPTPFRPTIRSFKHRNTLNSDKMLNEMRISEKQWSAFYNKEYISSMPNITVHMRHKLINWLVDVHRRFRLVSSVLFSCICLIDRVLSHFRDIPHSDLQLIGCCCLWIAIKNHEIYSPDIRDFIVMCAGSITASDMKEIELNIVQILGCDFTIPTVCNYMMRYTDIALAYMSNSRAMGMRQRKSQQMVKHFMMLCAEYGCVSYDLCLEKPSKLAAAVFIYVCLGLNVFTEQQFIDDQMFKIIGYEIEELFKVLRVLHLVVLRDLKSRRFSAIKDKYQSRNHACITKHLDIFGKLKTEYFMKSDGGCGRGYGWQKWQKKQ